ncbi:MAG: helix-turn-helix domain-containing protein [Rubrivivax sp.]|nr:MAG: helix-turn-helix domain-containing protein [Rubrivivax sp.]
MPKSPKVKAIKVWILVFPGFQLLDASGPAQVFATANDEADDAAHPHPYEVHLVSMTGGMVPSSAGLAMLTEVLPSRAALRGSTLLVSGGKGVEDALHDKTLISWITKAQGVAVRCGSVCSGAFLLAQAGLLNHRHAVTHWLDVDALKKHYPQVRVQDDALHTKDGNIYTSAGVTAGIDLSLSLLEEDLGRAAALNVAKRLVVYYKRPGGQRQFSSALLAQADEAGVMGQLTEWLRPRLRQAIDVKRMAASLALTPRTLHRRVRDEAGTTPAQWLNRMRLEAACALLETRHGSLKQVARQSGFGTEYKLRRAFLLKLGVLPSDYRARFA